MVTTAIHSKSPGIIFLFLLVLAQYQYLQLFLFYRQPDGLLLTVVLMVLLNLLGAVSLCKVFLRFITHLGVLILLKNLLAHFRRPASCSCTSDRESQRSVRTPPSKDRGRSQAPCKERICRRRDT